MRSTVTVVRKCNKTAIKLRRISGGRCLLPLGNLRYVFFHTDCVLCQKRSFWVTGTGIWDNDGARKYQCPRKLVNHGTTKVQTTSCQSDMSLEVWRDFRTDFGNLKGRHCICQERDFHRLAYVSSCNILQAVPTLHNVQILLIRQFQSRLTRKGYSPWDQLYLVRWCATQ